MVLAYVFWHRSAPATPDDRYPPAVADFHATLASAPGSGLIASASWQLSGAPWAPAEGGWYVDWYVVGDFAALGELNQVAVTGSCQGPHNRVAALSGAGSAGLYRLRSGPAELATGWETWFAKPEGWSYRDLDVSLQETLRADGHASLWQRQLVLGPTAEFCLVTPDSGPAAALGAEFRVTTIGRQPLGQVSAV